MNLQACISMCSTMAGCYAMNWYEDQMCMLLLNRPVLVNDRPCKKKIITEKILSKNFESEILKIYFYLAYPEEFNGGDAGLVFSGKLYDKCSAFTFTQERRFDSGQFSIASFLWSALGINYSPMTMDRNHASNGS